MSINCRICGDQLADGDPSCPTCGCEDPQPHQSQTGGIEMKIRIEDWYPIDGKWHHCCSVFDGDNVKRYVDGKLVYDGPVACKLEEESK